MNFNSFTAHGGFYQITVIIIKINHNVISGQIEGDSCVIHFKVINKTREYPT